MKRILWLTDPHLNFVPSADVERFLQRVAEQQPDAVLLSGDIGESHDVEKYLRRLDEGLDCPLFFVLGNHDFYFGSIRETRRRVSRLAQQCSHLHYLTTSGMHALTPATGLVGHDGWADGRVGDYERSYVMLNDYKLIQELAGVGKQARLPLLHQLGDEAAHHVRQVLPRALAAFPHVFFVTHVPPLREACWYEGRISDDEWAPHFTCQAVGDAILDVMREHPDNQLTVLCGHTHSPGQCRPADNVVIFTGGARYGEPEIVRVFEVE